MKYVWVVLRKELKDGARERRAIFSMLFGAILSPLIFGFMFTTIANRQKDAAELKIPIQGIENAPALGDWLRQQTDVSVVAAPADPVAAVSQRKEDVVVLIGKDFAKQMSQGSPAEIKIVADSTSDSGRPKVDRVRRLIGAYSAQMASLRLAARGISPNVAVPIKMEDVEISSAQQRLARLLSFLPLMLVLAALTGGMSIAIDSTAGERERGSLEPLLLSPVPRWTLTTGKWLAACTFGCVSVLFSMILTVNTLRRVPWQELGIRFRISDADLMTLLALILPLVFLLSGLVMFVSTFARSFKEAQGYIGMLMLVPMLPGILATVYPMSGRPWLAPIPVVGQYALAADVLGGKPPHVGFYLLAGGAALAIAVALVLGAARLLERERVIFGR